MTSTATVKSTRDYAVPPDTVVEASGVGEAFDLGVRAGKPVLIVLRVTEIIEQESLLLSIWGSPDGKDWGAKALFQFPERFYQSVTPASLDLAQRPEIKFLQARWHVNRWGRGYPRPYFKIGVEIQDATSS
ncbi:MAG: hypothetical protein ABSB82_17600 [Terriglobia bacterium]|jgi:hypothetical protein